MSGFSSQWLYSATNAGSLVSEDSALVTSAGGLVITRNIAPMVIFGSSVIRTTTLAADSNGPVAGATILTIGSSGLVIGPLALVVLMLSHRFWWFD